MHVRVLLAHLPLRGDALWPADDERVRDSAAVGLALPAPERRVARPGPAPWVVVEVLRAADLVDRGEAVRERFGCVVEELRLVGRPGRAALGARAVVGDHHDQRVVELADRLEVVQQPADLVVGVREEPGEDLHHPRVQTPLIVAQRIPRRHVRVMARQLSVLRDDPELLLACEDLLPVGVPTVVEGALVAVGPLLRHVVRGVRRAGAEVQVERLVGIDLFGVGDELDRLVGEVLGQVVALLGAPRRLDLVVVVDELGVPLARVAAEEAVVALEPAPQRPAVIRPGGGLLARRDQVPLADHVGVVAVRQQHLRQEAVLERDQAVVARVAGRHLGDARHPVAVVVAAGDHARPARRAQRRRVHVVVAQPIGGERGPGSGSRSGCRSSRAGRSRCRRARRTARSACPSAPARGPATPVSIRQPSGRSRRGKRRPTGTRSAASTRSSVRRLLPRSLSESSRRRIAQSG